ncbi:unnamed protein product [Dicrocoelium dendriticum]|nr:unnamed protein product [Dicrocoelium dendriticum]
MRFQITILPDDVQLIAQEAREFMNSFDIVLTSGGIGPTHDHVTFEGDPSVPPLSLGFFLGLTKTLNERTLVHPELLNVVENFFGFDSCFGALHRLACIPGSFGFAYGIDQSTGRQSYYPVVKVRNIYALPGIPILFHTSFEIIKVSGQFKVVQTVKNMYLRNMVSYESDHKSYLSRDPSLKPGLCMIYLGALIPCRTALSGSVVTKY